MMPRRSSSARSAVTAPSGDRRVVSTRISGCSGASYGESMPVKFFSSPRRAFLYRPFGSRVSATASGVSTNTSMNSPASQQLARHAPLGAERRDERHEHDQPGVDHQPRHLGDAPDVLDAVGFGEAEVLVQPVAHVVAVEQIGVPAERVQPLLDQVGDRRLAGAGQAR